MQRRSEIEARLATLEEQSRTAERRVIAARLTAPMDGVVNQLEVFTIGAVARAGEQLLRVVPKDQDVEIEAIFTNRGWLQIGAKSCGKALSPLIWPQILSKPPQKSHHSVQMAFDL